MMCRLRQNQFDILSTFGVLIFRMWTLTNRHISWNYLVVFLPHVESITKAWRANKPDWSNQMFSVFWPIRLQFLIFYWLVTTGPWRTITEKIQWHNPPETQKDCRMYSWLHFKLGYVLYVGNLKQNIKNKWNSKIDKLDKLSRSSTFPISAGIRTQFLW